jgi:serine/threonine-protein kinase
VCAALEAAHAAGVVHRDVKASNIAFTGGLRTAKLLDFGIAKLLSPDPAHPWLTTVGHRIGTPNIMAPEQFLGGPIDARTDVYALGVLLYRLLTGRPPFEERNLAALTRQHLEDPAPRPSRVAAVSPALDAVVLRCLAKRPEHRFDSAKAFVAALGDALGRGAGGADSTRPAPSPGVAIYVDVRLRTSGDLDEALIGDVEALLDLAEGMLTRAGYVLAQATGTGVLAVRLLPLDPGEHCLARRSAVTLALALHDELARRPGANQRVHANVAVHAGEARIRVSSTPEILGGTLLNTAAWAPRGEAAGVCATKEAVESLPDLEAMTQGTLALLDAETVYE